MHPPGLSRRQLVGETWGSVGHPPHGAEPRGGVVTTELSITKIGFLQQQYGEKVHENVLEILNSGRKLVTDTSLPSSEVPLFSA